jgi:hypothetical protein
MNHESPLAGRINGRAGSPARWIPAPESLRWWLCLLQLYFGPVDEDVPNLRIFRQEVAAGHNQIGDLSGFDGTELIAGA